MSRPDTPAGQLVADPAGARAAGRDHGGWRRRCERLRGRHRGRDRNSDHPPRQRHPHRSGTDDGSRNQHHLDDDHHRAAPPSDQRTLEPLEVIGGDISPKSVVHSGDGYFIANNMMYRHTMTLYDRDMDLVATIPDTVDLRASSASTTKVSTRARRSRRRFTSDGAYAYVSNYQMYGPGFGNPGDDGCSDGDWDQSFLYRIDIAEAEIDQVIQVGAVPKFVAVTPDDRTVLVTNWCTYDLSVVDTETGEEDPADRHRPLPRGIAVTQDGSKAYIAVMGSTDIAVVFLDDDSCPGSTGVGGSPRHVVLSPDDAYLYVTLNRDGRDRQGRHHHGSGRGHGRHRGKPPQHDHRRGRPRALRRQLRRQHRQQGHHRRHGRGAGAGRRSPPHRHHLSTRRRATCGSPTTEAPSTSWPTDRTALTTTTEERRPSTDRRRHIAVAVVVAAAAAGGALADSAPTGRETIDLIERTLAADARHRRRGRLAPLSRSSCSPRLPTMLASPPWLFVGIAAIAIIMTELALRRGPDPVVGALVAALSAQVALRLGDVGATGLTALVGIGSGALVVGSAIQQRAKRPASRLGGGGTGRSRRPRRRRIHRWPARSRRHPRADDAFALSNHGLRLARDGDVEGARPLLEEAGASLALAGEELDGWWSGPAGASDRRPAPTCRRGAQRGGRRPHLAGRRRDEPGRLRGAPAARTVASTSTSSDRSRGRPGGHRRTSTSTLEVVASVQLAMARRPAPGPHRRPGGAPHRRPALHRPRRRRGRVASRPAGRRWPAELLPDAAHSVRSARAGRALRKLGQIGVDDGPARAAGPRSIGRPRQAGMRLDESYPASYREALPASNPQNYSSTPDMAVATRGADELYRVRRAAP